MELAQKLSTLYNDETKHMQYQNIPQFVREALGYQETIDENWRGDTARYKYLLRELKLNNDSVVGDIGANTGFFTLSLAKIFSNSRFFAYEMNPNHVSFINLINTHFELENVITREVSIDLGGIEQLERHSVILNFNVLHHAGVDFDQGKIRNTEEFHDYCLNYLKKLSQKTKLMFFQMGYNWGGNKQKPIISVADQAGMVKYQVQLFKQSGWQVENIALFDFSSKQYFNIPQSEIEPIVQNKGSMLEAIISQNRLPEASEFYKRPFFTVRSIG